ncbi:MAG: hypothetical protein JST21_12050 [Bacteroidetes bacterium]|nr:hypothetical protein [Bacteroidota bacterium]
MKKFLLVITTGICLVSCSKNVSKPGAANQNVFFQDANVSVENMIAESPASSTVTISFTTAFENNLSSIELMSGTTTNNFCTAKSVDLSGNSSTKKNYTFSDSNAKSSTMYYLLRFKDNNGNWTYSNYLTVKVD